MGDATHIVLRAVAKFALPVFLLVAFYLALGGDAQGWQGGMFAALAVALHALVFGPAATIRALPPVALRSAAALGAAALMAGAAIEPRLGAVGSALFASAGLFLVAGACSALGLLAVAGRAHALRDEDW
jgi:hypothetical protein